ncbi:protein kinase [Candidatus Uabimicrobium sp. HlEnr_7]|uniref:protein kinase domain-containing protein n=1 Tax=Candidatus Uabimicrobium helgolandensis TaxID=3095367 RepID=UPI003557B4B0
MQNEFELIEKSIDNIKIVEKLGGSALGNSYKIEHEQHGVCVLKKIAKKVTKNKKFVTRFFKELSKFKNLQSEKQLIHPNMGKVLEISDYENENLYIIREYAKGQELQQIIYSKKKLEIAEAEKILMQLISGVGFLHSYDFVFRNLKPNNIILDNDYNLKLVDFSLPPTQAQYLSPEQCKGKKSGFHSDIYSMGSIFFYYLTGRPVFVGATSKEIMEAHVVQETPDITKYRTDISSGIVNVLVKMLAKKVENRYQNCYELFFEAKDAAKDKELHYEPPKASETSIHDSKQLVRNDSSWKTTSQDTLETSTIQLVRSGNSWVNPEQNLETSTIQLIRDGVGWKMPGTKPKTNSSIKSQADDNAAGSAPSSADILAENSSAQNVPTINTNTNLDVPNLNIDISIPKINFESNTNSSDNLDSTPNGSFTQNFESYNTEISAEGIDISSNSDSYNTDFNGAVSGIDISFTDNTQDIGVDSGSIDLSQSTNPMSFQSYSIQADEADSNTSNNMNYLLERGTSSEDAEENPNNSLGLFFNPSTPSKMLIDKEETESLEESHAIPVEENDIEDIEAFSVSPVTAIEASANPEITIELPSDASIIEDDGSMVCTAIEANDYDDDDGDGDSLFEIYLNQGKVDTDDVLNVSDGNLEAITDDSLLNEISGESPEKTVTSEKFTTVFISKEDSEQQELEQFHDSVEIELDQSFFETPSIDISNENQNKDELIPNTESFGTSFSEDNFTAQNIASMYDSAQVDSQWLHSSPTDEKDSEFRQAAILFVRIKNKETQEKDLLQMVNFINEVTENIEVCVERYGGNLETFMGSYLLSVFSTSANEEDAWAAIQTSLEIKNDFAKLYPDVQIYSGIHYGETVNADIGSSKTKRNTSIGDNVDVANELVRLCEYYQCKILISEDVYVNHKNKLIVREIDYTLVNNKPLRIYELICFATDFLDEDIIKAHDLYSKGRRMYNEGKFAQALEKFIGISCTFPDDRPTAFHVERCIQFIERAPINWDGVWRPKS